MCKIMTKARARKRYGSKFWDKTSSVICPHCSNSVFFDEDKAPDVYKCPTCGKVNAE